MVMLLVAIDLTLGLVIGECMSHDNLPGSSCATQPLRAGTTEFLRFLHRIGRSAQGKHDGHVIPDS